MQIFKYVDTAKLDDLFDKAEKLYPHYAYTPVGKGPDPRGVRTDRCGHFMRLPLGNGYNRWCFETDVFRDRFLIDYADQFAIKEILV